jgi:hypothetical protein
MRRDEVLARLREDELRLRSEFAVRSLALVGSAARDEAAEGSDVDLLVEYGRRVGLFHHVATALHLEALLGVPKVALVFRDAIVEELRPIIEGRRSMSSAPAGTSRRPRCTPWRRTGKFTGDWRSPMRYLSTAEWRGSRFETRAVADVTGVRERTPATQPKTGCA